MTLFAAIFNWIIGIEVARVDKMEKFRGSFVALLWNIRFIYFCSDNHLKQSASTVVTCYL